MPPSARPTDVCQIVRFSVAVKKNTTANATSDRGEGLKSKKLTSRAPLTHQQPLRHDQPIWLAKSHTTVSASAQPSRHRYDVIVVGAGISGALIAHALCGQGLHILVIDRRQPVRGSTAASTAMIQHEIDVPLHQLAQSIGLNKASRVWKRSAQALEELKCLIRDIEIKCAFQSRRTLFLSGAHYGRRALKTEAAARNEIGINAEFIDRTTLLQRHGIDRTGAIDSDISAACDPVQMTLGLLRDAKRKGVEIVSDVEVTDLREASETVFIATDQGKIIEARHAVFCTGYEFLECLRSQRHRLMSTFALASRPKLDRPLWLDDYLVWEGADPYLYFRSTPDSRIVVGGEDENGDLAYKDPDTIKRKASILTEKLSDLTGIALGRPDFTWSAVFGVTPDGLPMIGLAPGHHHVFVSMGFGGNGITFSKIAADLISAAILGHQDPDWDLFPVV